MLPAGRPIARPLPGRAIARLPRRDDGQHDARRVLRRRGRPCCPPRASGGCSLSGSPVFGFTSKRGKLLLEISRRMRCPRLNTSDVGYISMVNSYGVPGWSIVAVLRELAVARAHDAVADVQVDARGVVAARRIDVHQLGREVGVRAVGAGPQLHHQPARHFDVALERRRLEDQHVGARGERQRVGAEPVLRACSAGPARRAASGRPRTRRCRRWWAPGRLGSKLIAGRRRIAQAVCGDSVPSACR